MLILSTINYSILVDTAERTTSLTKPCETCDSDERLSSPLKTGSDQDCLGATVLRENKYYGIFSNMSMFEYHALKF